MVFDCSSRVTGRQFPGGSAGVCADENHFSVYVVIWTVEESLQMSVLIAQTRYTMLLTILIH